MNFELSQSSMKDFLKVPRNEWKRKWIDKIFPYDRSEAFIYGSILDGLLFDPEMLPRRFVTYRGKCKVSESLQAVIGLVVKKLKKQPFKQAVFEACQELNYGQRWKPETLLKKFEGLDDYIDFCKEHSNKVVVYPEFVKNIQDVAKYLVNHTHNEIYKYIVKRPSEDYSNVFQKTLRGKIKSIPCKVILDILHFDEVNSTVRIVDFKTTYDTERFVESVRKYGYDTQLSFYQEILKQNPDEYRGYTLLDPLNIVVAKKDLNIYVHAYSDYELNYSKYGDPKKGDIGWLQIIDMIEEYLNELK